MTILVGTSATHRAAYEAVSGRQMDIVRLFKQTQTAPWSDVGTLVGAGYHVIVSFKTPYSWAAVSTGSYDAQTDGIATYIAGLSHPERVIVCFNHEPEDDGMPSADFRAAATRVINRMKALSPTSGYAVILMDWTFDPASGRTATDWWVSAATFLGVDWYTYRGSKDPDRSGDPATQWATQTGTKSVTASDITNAFAFASGHGVPLLWSEYGCALRDPAIAPSDYLVRQGWIQSGADTYKTNPNLYAVTYFDMDFRDNKVNWAISGGTVPAEPGSVAALESFRSTPPPPARYPAGWGAVA